VLKVALGAGNLTTEILRQWGYSPLDKVELTWAEATGAWGYQIDRKTDAGAWTTIAEDVRALTHSDGPLADGFHSYRVWSVDAHGDKALSNVVTLYVSSAPEPPSGISYAWDSGTKTLTVSWTASPDSDVASYRVRSSEGAESLELADAPVQDTADLSWQKVFAGETGTWVVLVRAVDNDGNEEAHLEGALTLAFEAGDASATPAAPRLTEVEAVEDGKIAVSWLYDPYFEIGGPGGGVEARIYWDAGTGAIDWSVPLATVAMSGPAAATRYTWTSGPLTHGTEYRFCVRVASDSHPAGIETQNADEHEATVDSDVPTAAVLTAQIV